MDPLSTWARTLRKELSTLAINLKFQFSFQCAHLRKTTLVRSTSATQLFASLLLADKEQSQTDPPMFYGTLVSFRASQLNVTRRKEEHSGYSIFF